MISAESLNDQFYPTVLNPRFKSRALLLNTYLFNWGMQDSHLRQIYLSADKTAALVYSSRGER